MLTVSRGRRFIGSLLNLITLQGLIIGNVILMLTKGQTLGGKIMGYKFEAKGIGAMLRVWAGCFVSGIMYGFTFGIMWIVDCATMSKRNGWLWEKWFNCKKTNSK